MAFVNYPQFRWLATWPKCFSPEKNSGTLKILFWVTSSYPVRPRLGQFVGRQSWMSTANGRL